MQLNFKFLKQVNFIEDKKMFKILKNRIKPEAIYIF